MPGPAPGRAACAGPAERQPPPAREGPALPPSAPPQASQCQTVSAGSLVSEQSLLPGQTGQGRARRPPASRLRPAPPCAPHAPACTQPPGHEHVHTSAHACKCACSLLPAASPRSTGARRGASPPRGAEVGPGWRRACTESLRSEEGSSQPQARAAEQGVNHRKSPGLEGTPEASPTPAQSRTVPNYTSDIIPGCAGATGIGPGVLLVTQGRETAQGPSRHRPPLLARRRPWGCEEARGPVASGAATGLPRPEPAPDSTLAASHAQEPAPGPRDHAQLGHPGRCPLLPWDSRQ